MMHGYKETTCALYALLLCCIHSIMQTGLEDGDIILPAASELQAGRGGDEVNTPMKQAENGLLWQSKEMNAYINAASTFPCKRRGAL